MSAQKMMVNAVDPDGKWLYRVGGISALVLGIVYIITIPLYVYVGAPPSGGEARLKYLALNTTVWWTIPWSLRPNGLSLRTCRVIALPRVERGQQKRDAASNRIRGVVHCLRPGSYLVKLCLAH